MFLCNDEMLRFLFMFAIFWFLSLLFLSSLDPMLLIAILFLSIYSLYHLRPFLSSFIVFYRPSSHPVSDLAYSIVVSLFWPLSLFLLCPSLHLSILIFVAFLLPVVFLRDCLPWSCSQQYAHLPRHGRTNPSNQDFAIVHRIPTGREEWF